MTEQQTLRLESPDEQPALWCSPPPTVDAKGFVPLTEMKLITRVKDGRDRLWQSENGYLVSAQTTFNTGTTAAFGDGYYGIAAEGPIYSLQCVDGKGHDFCLPESGILNFEYLLFNGSEEIWSSRVIRVSRTESPVSKPVTVHFLHNGTSGAPHGFAMLESLGYKVFHHPIHPDTPQLDPLLQVIRGSAQKWPVHLVASGRASEACLEIAQRVSNLASVSIFSGSALRFTPWEIEGETLPHVVCDHSTVQPRGGSILTTRKVYAEAVADRENRDRGRIEVEKIDCPLHFFSGSDDQIWPSAAFSELGAQRRKAFGLEERTTHQTFPSVGYDLGPELGLPGLPTTERTLSHESTGFRLALGGKMGRQSRARRACWEKLIEVLV